MSSEEITESPVLTSRYKISCNTFDSSIHSGIILYIWAILEITSFINIFTFIIYLPFFPGLLTEPV